MTRDTTGVWGNRRGVQRCGGCSLAGQRAPAPNRWVLERTLHTISPADAAETMGTVIVSAAAGWKSPTVWLSLPVAVPARSLAALAVTPAVGRRVG
ncbi:MAG: hypothetical protein ABSD97_14225 [Acidimicrobiales bacterium]